MKAHLIAAVLFTTILGISLAHGGSHMETQATDERAQEYLAAVDTVLNQYADYGLDVQREALIRVSAYHYPEYAAEQVLAQLKNC